ncbi:MAG: transglutaminase family protein [Fimbriimonadaceae bacterium]
MILNTTHRTVYRYASASVDSHNEVRLRPLTDEFQTCLSFKLTTAPAAVVSYFSEPGGVVDAFSVAAPHQELVIVGQAEVETHTTDPFEGIDLITDDWHFYDRADVRNRFAEFLAPSKYTEPTPGVAVVTKGLLVDRVGSVARFLLALNAYIHDEFDYVPGATDVHSKLVEVFDLRAGVCQDFTHVMIACCRMAGVPARYVSGYLYCGGNPALRGNQATHAWLECPMPSGRWLCLDPTNDLLANDRYVRIHVGRDYADVTPTRGVYIGGPGIGLDVSVQVERAADRCRG